MDKQLLKFLNREVNYVETMCGIGREPLDERDFMTIKPKELCIDEPLYGFWNSNRTDVKPEKDEAQKPSKKTYYTKVFIKELIKYPKEKLSYEYMGIYLHLTAFMERDSGYLICGRGKKKRNMSKSDMAKILNISESTVRRLIDKLEELNLIEQDNGLKILGSLFAKGRNVPCESNLNKE